MAASLASSRSSAKLDVDSGPSSLLRSPPMGVDEMTSGGAAFARGFSDSQRALLDQEYPRFSPAEMNRRRAAVLELMAENSVDHLLAWGVGARSAAVSWLAQWLVTNEAQLVVTPGERDLLQVQYFNHVPLARKLASDADVRWGGASSIAGLIDELRRRGAVNGRVGVIGPLPDRKSVV